MPGKLLGQVLGLSVGLLSISGFAAESGRYVPGQILLKTRAAAPEAALQSTLRRHGGFQKRLLHKGNVKVIQVGEADADALLETLRQDPTIEFAERDYLAEAALQPNDPVLLNNGAWHIAKIQTPTAWNTTTGNNVIVAVLDSGVNFQHPDLAANLLPGFDFVNYDSDATDDFGHGTSVAGAAAAVGNNGVGVVGVAYGAKILPVKVMDAFGFAAYSAIAEGIRYAVDHGARVINLSIAGSSASSTLQSAIDYAWSNNVVVVAAAGNNANTTPQYPAACAHVLAISATTSNDTRATFSSYGSHLALAAPGEAIATTSRNLTNPYFFANGTSLASPQVAASAVLMIAANSRLTADQVGALLEQTADDLGASGFDTSFGYGRLNAARAVAAALSFTSSPPAIVTQPTNQIILLGGTATFAVSTTNASAAVYQWRFNNTPITGATNLVLCCTNAQARQAGGYSVIVANASGSVTSQVAALSVTLPAPPQMLPLMPAGNGELTVSWTALPGCSYRVQVATNLAQPNWISLAPDVLAASSVASVRDQPHGAPARFYRVLLLP